MFVISEQLYMTKGIGKDDFQTLKREESLPVSEDGRVW